MTVTVPNRPPDRARGGHGPLIRRNGQLVHGRPGPSPLNQVRVVLRGKGWPRTRPRAKRKEVYQGTVDAASIMIWFRDPTK